MKTASGEKITCLFALLAGAVKGKWDIVVKNPDEKTAKKRGAFTLQ